ncbi:hypothetical protein ACFOWM_03330 [Ferruginibacter yonginensis]|uniref:Uncharacterized protein n=1 Tax=Ferruginibacter yonginensis TaxID=1310416 RepID=A0ABV8QQI2_9BACT
MIVIETNSLYAGRIFNDVFNILVPTNHALNVVGAIRLFKYKSVELGEVQIIKVIDNVIISKMLSNQSSLMLTGYNTLNALKLLQQQWGPGIKYSNVCLSYEKRNLTNQGDLMQQWWADIVAAQLHQNQLNHF